MERIFIMTFRSVHTLYELYYWIRLYCQDNLDKTYIIKIEKNKDSTGKITYHIEDRIT